MTGRILIADGDEGRARRLKAACEARGFAAAHALHGPSALEQALATVPDVIVATGMLPMIEAERLAEILRANPRTQGIPFLFLGTSASRTDESAFDEALAGETPPEEVAQHVDGMVTRQSRMHAVAREAGDERALVGQLTQISLLDLVQLLHLNRRTGTIELERPEPGGRNGVGRVLLREGDVVQAHEGPVEAEKALYRLLGWREGRFAFRPHTVQVSQPIATPTRALLMEGARHLDEWDRVRAALPPLDARVELKVPSSDLPNAVQPLTQEVLLLLEIYSRVGDVVDHCSFPDYQVLRTLRTLADRGLVELRLEPEPRVPPSAWSLVSTARIRRLREGFVIGGPTRPDQVEARLVLVAEDPGAASRLLRRLAPLPGMRLAPVLEEGLAPEALVPVARLELAERVVLEVLHVPVVPGCEPLWGLAAHRALASLLVLEGDPAPDSPVLRVACALRELPHRTVPVWIGRPEGAAPPEGLAARLELAEPEDLVVVGDDDAEALGQRLLARVLP